MSRFWVLLAFVAVAGSAAGWGINYTEFGHRPARMGEMIYGGEVTGQNISDFYAQAKQTKNPIVELPGGDTFDFGTMAPEEKGRHTFVIKNVGEGDLRLRLGATTCKCTLGTLDNDVLKTGEQTEVRMEWNVKTDQKTFGQSAQLLTNDPRHYAIDLKIEGRVVNELEMIPDALTFGNISSDQEATVTAKLYSYLDRPIENPTFTFSSDELNEFTDVKIEPFDLSEADGASSSAKQGFDIEITIKPGMKQGAVSQNATFSFTRPQSDSDSDDTTGDDKDGNEERRSLVVPITGKVVGSITMIPNPKLTGSKGGSYIYDFGEVPPEGPFTAKTFVVLKGSDRDNRKLSIESVEPEGVIEASFGENLVRSSMTLCPLEIKLIPGPQRIQRLGRNKEDYARIQIVSDNGESVDQLVIGVKFSMEPK
ncbi:hypothetical protein Pla52o_40230 [Novipirellula galeiformis]|uniref:DUF1573 domain-containing protein n=1 Tax=Novipirellula galeiformis TaxID=2528004 RepID=A0A5C6CC18_9BACT|nr:DUF1573 domain-containing protein [Novipirellula galeiformis]TWU20991.1 hypothetical protein Pla52o_40230 [Novipirellula galeiformis]